ncbi:MAG TPA: electron transfer flavoprotein subunit beta/FixA family protein [Desulfobacterales bacterium]
MEIVVLLKQVPATESAIQIADDGVSIKTADLKWVISPYDEFAVEEALRIREAQGGKVTILTVGPDKATEAVRTALAMGADEGVLINDEATRGCDGLQIAKVLTAALTQMPYDLIIAGQRAVDDDNFLVGTAVAEALGIANISIVNRQEIVDGKIRCRRTIEGGTVEIESELPVLFTTQRGLNEPRYASLPGIMKAKKKPLAVKSLADIGLDAATLGEPKTRIVALKPPPERKGGRLIEGESAGEKAAELVRLLAEEAKVI